MRPQLRCGLCMLEWMYGRIALQNEMFEVQQKVFKQIMDLLLEKIDLYKNLGRLCNEALTLVEDYIEHHSVFWENLKKNTNENARQILPKAKTFIDVKKDEQQRLKYAFNIAACANVAPIAAPSSSTYTFPEVMHIIEGGAMAMVIRKGDVLGAVNDAKDIFYLTDNAGEIGFDSILIEELKKKGKKVTLVVKDGLFFEDATMEDALFFGLDEVCDEIITVNKFFIPDETENPVNKAFHSSDLIISKGTGNYEALSGVNNGKKFIYVLKAKCDPIASELKVKEGNFVIKLAR